MNGPDQPWLAPAGQKLADTLFVVTTRPSRSVLSEPEAGEGSLVEASATHKNDPSEHLVTDAS